MYYTRIGRLLACKMAMLLALIFAACSNDTSPSTLAHEGGYTEETGIYALSGRVGDVYPKLARVASTSSEANTLYARKGTIVTIYELDTLTLDTTGRVFVDTIDNEDGKFAFADISLNSPFVLIKTLDACITELNDCSDSIRYKVPVIYVDSAGIHVDSSAEFRYHLSAIVDLRELQEVSVNSLSHLKTPLVQKHIAEGMSFAEASKKAEQEVLESLGIYADLGDFEKIQDKNSELNYVKLLMNELQDLFFVYHLWDSDKFAKNLNDSLRQNVYLHFIEKNYRNYYATLPTSFSAWGDEAEEYHSNALKMIDYEVGFVAEKFGLGQCTESRENEANVIEGNHDSFTDYSNQKHSLVCHSNKWIVGHEKMEYTSGTITDERDGKTYKTVTYNWDNTTQTWMAENLNFADTTSSSIDSSLRNNLLGRTACFVNDPSCENYGRFYAWRAAMNLDSSSIRMTMVKLHIDSVPGSDDESHMDTIVVEDMCSSSLPYNPQEIYDCDLIPIEGDGQRSGWRANRNEALDSVYDYCEAKYDYDILLDYSKFIPASRPVAHQGACPEGWRIPNKNDWETLFKNLAKQYNIKNTDIWEVLRDDYAIGFGYTRPMIARKDMTTSEIDGITELTVHFASVPDVDDADSNPLFRTDGSIDPGRPYIGNINASVLVRCIKN